MRTSMVGAAFLLVGAGAATVAATDTTGNNIALNGSDTLHDVTNDIIADCATQFGATWTNNKITYAGGGSGVGQAQMAANLQQIAPMSRALKNTEYCSGFPAPSSPTLTADLLVGIDGVAIVGNTVNICTTGADGVTPINPANGFGIGTSFTTSTGSYTFVDSFDALKVLYFGLTNDGVYNCSSPTRKALIAKWTNLFTTDCATGDGKCGALTHAWRRSDLSGTTDAFVNILNPAGRGVGTLPGVPGASKKIIPFCNAVDATSGVASNAGSSDFSDADPLRTPCGAAGAVENVCGYTGKMAGATGAGSFQGDLGVVLPILIPDGTTTHTADIFQTNQACTNSCVLVAPIAGAVLPPGYKCPDGNLTIGGACLMPATQAGDPRCVANQLSQCAGAAGRPDGRRYNLVTIVPTPQIPTKAFRGTTPFQFAFDISANFVQTIPDPNNPPPATIPNPAFNPRFMTGSFHRIHMYQTGTTNVPVAGTTGQCREDDDTSQIGCLVDSDPCSIGYAGREASRLFPGVGGAGSGGDPARLKALAVSEAATGSTPAVPLTPPFTPSTANSNPDEALINLLNSNTITTAEPFYPLSRRLYLATMYGFGNTLNGEHELSQCYANNANLHVAIPAHGFVEIPGGVECLDYPETSTSTVSPPPNVRGSGNVALPGCGTLFSGNTEHNSCLVAAEAPSICGDGIKTPDEGCDDGNTVSGDGCSSTCTVE